jgi:hypothetical protein
MKKKYCQICGGEIVFHYETPTKVFRIEGETLVRDDNNLLDKPELNPYCSNDKEHYIKSEYNQAYNLELNKWIDLIETYFKEKKLYDL